MHDYDKNLDKNKANYVPLTPISFIERTKDIYPNYEALVYKKRTYTWKQVYDRSIKFASALEKHGIKLGDTVSIMAANTPELFEAHYSVPMTGAVLNAINTRLDSKTVGYILKHADAKALIVDRQFHGVVKKALENFGKKILIVDIVDKQTDLKDSEKIGEFEYESFLEQGDSGYEWKRPKDEWQAITLNYTSGTTGKPKGVMLSHENILSGGENVKISHELKSKDKALCVLPLYHINGLIVTVIVPLVSQSSLVICEKFSTTNFWKYISKFKCTWFCVVPTIISSLFSSKVIAADSSRPMSFE